ncbi:BMP/retinoic acid-inducible neural-specific protein 3-like isoform X1 [Notolabrus celidotus]|uniref:BMP/retinoic acid-inducible neural-specific protein 3-like isoform X1 n=2 Tax=Notolabrus celidotus TaxID=1203425 RepID=UPI00148F56D9|nr:BMP/retinoic acid-inducible neural-specific protein 3-like isoform X1 [Notolabrus celidotus]XP_034565510.1 BMP/retinoic acid-inducible neural-specific protein 3-like isoform X1 [Notolabrus celidotus]
MSGPCISIRLTALMFLWKWLTLSLLQSWVSEGAWAADPVGAGFSGSAGPLGWLLSDKGPFHHSQEFVDFTERYQQGFTTKYKIYREFGRWKVNSLALERQENNGFSLPLDPEFLQTIRQLGRRPSLGAITDNIIRKYGTHFLLSATLGGEESLMIFVDKRKLSRTSEVGESNGTAVTLEALHQLAASYFIDRESTLHKLHHIQIASTAIKVTETRTGPLGCSNYDNLDSVSSVLVQSPENKIHLQGLQAILPDYLRARFVQAALSYIGCNEEGQFVCRDNDCWCQCAVDYPQCNCPEVDLKAMEASLRKIRDSWNMANQDFEESDEFQNFVRRLPTSYALNMSAIQYFWKAEPSVHQRYKQLELGTQQLLSKARRIVNKLFALSKRCRTLPKIIMLRERPFSYWLHYILSIMYCSENNHIGSYLEETRSCSCPYEHPPCQGVIPCTVGEGTSCASCSYENRSRCATCNQGYMLSQGVCRNEVPDSTDHYIGFETDLQDMELRYLLQKRDNRISIHGIFVSNDVRLNNWFDPSWRKRMLLTLKSNKYKSNHVHMLLGMSLQICLTKNSTLDPLLSVYINPFGGSHSESWIMPIDQNNYPDWERTKLDFPYDCYNWTLTLGNKWKTFFETVHFYLRSRIRGPAINGNGTVYYEPLEYLEPGQNLGYMKINSIQVYGYSMHFDPEAIQDLILQLDYPYTQGSQDSALLQLLEIRDRVNRLSPPGAQPLDLFSCLLRHRLKLSTTDVARIQAALQTFSAKQPNSMEYETTKLCS